MCRKTPISVQADERHFPGKTSKTEGPLKFGMSLLDHMVFSNNCYTFQQSTGHGPTC